MSVLAWWEVLLGGVSLLGRSAVCGLRSLRLGLVWPSAAPRPVLQPSAWALPPWTLPTLDVTTVGVTVLDVTVMDMNAVNLAGSWKPVS